MATAEWTDERLNDAFDRLMAEMAAMRADMKDMRAELKGDIADLRTELNGDIAALRADLKADVADLRAERRVFWPVLIGSYISVMGAFIATQL
jgi:hypothetical protein